MLPYTAPAQACSQQSPQACAPANAAVCIPASNGTAPHCSLLAGIAQGWSPTYAAVARQPPPPSKPLGRPMVKLPVSQLSLGRTTAPWQGSAWNTRTSRVVGDVLRVDYPRGSGTSPKDPPGGINFKARPHCLPAADLTFRYKVRFAETFDWGKGGKLPGIFIGSGDASGGEHSPYGASFRTMWRPDGKIIAYVYPPSGVRQPAAYRDAAKKGYDYGDTLFDGAGLKVGRTKWNDIIMRVKLNSFDEDDEPRDDGTITLSVNGQPASLSGIIWRRKPSVQISHLLIVSFYGGKWKCPRTTYAEFTDFACVT